MRLFVAFDIPEDVRDSVESAVARWRERYPRAKWVPKPNQHVTLKFLGATWPRLVEWVRDSVGQAARANEQARTRVTGFGAFPNERRGRVLWAGLDDDGRRLARIAASLDEGLSREFAPEKRAFTPHLTVARFEPPVELQGLEDVRFESDPFDVDRIVLYRSHLRRPAPFYERLATFGLADA